MRRLVASFFLPLLVLLPLCSSHAESVATPRRQVDVCFVLDTTGSMAGLLEAAKQKIWFIASEIASAPSKPEVRFCLLAFRDRGDEYVTQHHDLSADLDAIHAELLALTSGGGGDTPEAVNQALSEAVENTTWSQAPNSLRVIFLVGDAPPHTDYDEPQYPQIAERAKALGILINPVLCGADEATRDAFAQIAARGGGQSAVLADPAQVQRIETPMDQDLAALEPRLERTLIRYGAPTAEAEPAHPAAALDHATAADRAAFVAARGRMRDGSGDLIEAIDAGELSLASLDRSQLPAQLRSLSEAELGVHLASVRAERDGLRRVIASLLSQRREFIAARSDDGADAGFDRVVAAIVQRQLASAPDGASK
jgi:Mg-chelatase subunit ChlD